MVQTICSKPTAPHFDYAQCDTHFFNQRNPLITLMSGSDKKLYLLIKNTYISHHDFIQFPPSPALRFQVHRAFAAFGSHHPLLGRLAGSQSL